MRIVKTIILSTCVSICSNTLADNIHNIQYGKELYGDGRWSEARLELLNVKKSTTIFDLKQLQEIDYYLALCAVELGDTAAEDILSEFEVKYPESIYRNNIFFKKAMLYCSQERYDEAVDEFKRVDDSLLSADDYNQFHMRVGYIFFREGDYDSARNHFIFVDKKSDIYEHALYYKSYISYLRDENKAAKEGFDALRNSEIYGSIIPYYLVQLGLDSRDYRGVLEQGEQLIQSSSPQRRMELARSMAESAFRLEEYNDAMRYIEIYRANGGEMNREENYILGFSLYRTTQYSKAIEALRQACGKDDALTQNASYHLADCYLRAGDKSSAMKSFAMAVNENYNTEIAEEALFNYGKLQYELGNGMFNETINVLTKYIQKYPNSKRIQQTKNLLIASYFNSNNYSAAYLAIKEIDNPDAELRAALQKISLFSALESFNKGDLKSATALLNESLKINISPKYSSIAQFWLGEINFTLKDYSSALNDYNTYLIRAPKSDDMYNIALYNIGYCKLMLDSDNESLGYFNRYIENEKELNYYRGDAHNRIGDIYYGKRQFDLAKDYYKRGTWSKFDTRYYSQYQLALIEGILGDKGAKINRLKDIISTSKGEYVSDAMYELGSNYISDSNYKDGVQTLENFVRSYPTSEQYPQALSDLGLAYLNLGNKAKSLEYYNLAIKSSPKSSIAKDALQGVREIYVNDGEVSKYFAYAESIGVESNLSEMTKDSLSFTSAQRVYLRGGSFTTEASKALNSYLEQYPKGYYTSDALFYLGDCYLKDNKNEEAITVLSKLLDSGRNQYSERVYDKLSQITYQEGQFAKSAELYRELYNISSSNDKKIAASVGYVDATIASNDNDAIILMADDVIRMGEVDPKALVKAKYAKASIYFTDGRKEEALSIFADLSSDPNSPQGAEANYRLIEAAYDVKAVDKAEKMIFAFSETNTRESYWLAKSFLILGDIYSSREDFFQARATYQSIVDGYANSTDGIIDEAKTKINKLP